MTITLERLLQDLKIPADWDYLMVGDGSGSSWNRGVGWACAVISNSGDRSIWRGCANMASINFAEPMAYLAPLAWLAACKPADDVWRVRIISDSKLTCDRGSAVTINNGPIWRAIEDIQREGLLVSWHWLRRDGCELNKLVDDISRKTRVLLEEQEGKISAEFTGRLHQANPGQASILDIPGNN